MSLVWDYLAWHLALMTSDSLHILVGGLAVYRLARLFVLEEGPWGIFERVRLARGIQTVNGLTTCCFSVTSRGKVIPWWMTDRTALMCLHCTAVWMALWVLLVLPWWSVVLLAMAGIASVLMSGPWRGAS